MLSVKGLTVCTPEFHKVAREGELRYENTERIENARRFVSETDFDFADMGEVLELIYDLGGSV